MRIPTRLEGEYIVRIMDMPDGSKGCVVYDDDGFSNVYINARLSQEQRVKEFWHEIHHIIKDDLNNDDDISTVEARA